MRFKNFNLKNLKIQSGNLLAFTRTGHVNAWVSIALIHSTCPAGSSWGNSTLAVWAAAQRLAWVSLALCVTQLARAVLTTQYWQSDPRHHCSRQQLQSSCDSSLQSKVNLNLLLSLSSSLLAEVQVQVYCTAACWPQSLWVPTCCNKCRSWSLNLKKPMV